MSTDYESELSGRKALVTGAGRGIGRATSLELAKRGAELALVGRDAERLESVAAEIRGLGGCATVLATDIAEPGAVDDLARETDVLVHNAASFATYSLLEDLPTDALERVFSVGLVAVARLDGSALSGMKARGFGRLIYVGSSAGARGARGQAAYAAAKSGLEGLMRSSALEGARHGVTANLLELGLIDTERIREAVKPEVRERIIARTPVGRLGETTEIADAVAFLASPRASFITGAVLPVSGGLGLGLYPEQLA